MLHQCNNHQKHLIPFTFPIKSVITTKFTTNASISASSNSVSMDHTIFSNTSIENLLTEMNALLTALTAVPLDCKNKELITNQ